MATIALDATYAADLEPTGISVYSRRLIESLATLASPHRFFFCYRLSRCKARRRFFRPGQPGGAARCSVRLFQEPLTFWLPWQAEVFHSLAQRTPPFRFQKEIVTIFDIFPLTGRDYSTPGFQKKFSALLVEAAGRATRIITASQSTADQLVERASVAKEKIRVIPCGVDLPARTMTAGERARERERLVGKGNEMVLSVGVIQTRKNTLNALRAIESLPQRYRLVLAGGDGHGSEAVHEYIRKQGMAPRVAVLGYVPAEQMPILYEAASVFLFPSFEEGFGLPVLEAMAHGLPVVASRTSSLPEVGGEAALYVDPHEPRDIAEKIRQAVEDAKLRARMIRAGLERANQFTWKRTAGATLRVYDEVLAM